MLKLTSRESGSTQGADAMSLGSGPMGVLFLITTSCSVHRKSEPLNHGPKTLMSECECVCVCVCTARGEGRRGKEPYYSILFELGDPIFRGKRRAAAVRKITLGLERSGSQSYLRT